MILHSMQYIYVHLFHVTVTLDVDIMNPIGESLLLYGGITHDFSSFCWLSSPAKASYYENG